MLRNALTEESSMRVEITHSLLLMCRGPVPSELSALQALDNVCDISNP